MCVCVCVCTTENIFFMLQSTEPTDIQTMEYGRVVID